jgi:hypothetical protein
MQEDTEEGGGKREVDIILPCLWKRVTRSIHNLDNMLAPDTTSLCLDLFIIKYVKFHNNNQIILFLNKKSYNFIVKRKLLLTSTKYYLNYINVYTIDELQK